MSSNDITSVPSLFSRTLDECRVLYVSSGQLCANEHPQLLAMPGDKFVELMDDLHRALVLKVYFSVCEADRKWSSGERHLAEVLMDSLWGERLTGETLRQAAREAAGQAVKLKWYSLVRPFDQLVPLRDRIGDLETLVMRLANIVARADGQLHPKEAGIIKSIQDELHHHLRPIPIDEPNEHEATNAIGAQAVESLKKEANDICAASRPHSADSLGVPSADTSKAASKRDGKRSELVTLEGVLTELDALIGLEQIKGEVRTLTNFLKMQQQREQAGLPETDVSLHMVFTGNPGTGKTSVARIVGRLFGAMGILKRGHLVETDRSGLVAEYIGQTGPKANKKIDESLDGVLFIDEAYSLVAHGSEDPYGHEAVQTLLKRAEDDRDRLVVILAGYPDEMQELLQSNPGLSSRFSRRLQFDDYPPVELARIFGAMCAKNHYKLSSETRARLLLGLDKLHRCRDRCFGNGRTVRNLFEHAIRRMANRIADIEQITVDALSRLDPGDIEFTDLAANWQTDCVNGEPRFRFVCPGCRQTSIAPGKYLGKKVRCPKCKQDFAADWGEPVTGQDGRRQFG
jgi:SpoVK/Ycf46/Vps4 family AAA+-type ATPase